MESEKRYVSPIKLERVNDENVNILNIRNTSSIKKKLKIEEEEMPVSNKQH